MQVRGFAAPPAVGTTDACAAALSQKQALEAIRDEANRAPYGGASISTLASTVEEGITLQEMR